MQYCKECHSVEQGTIIKQEDGYTDEELIEIGHKEASGIAKRMGNNLKLTDAEALEWGKDKTSYEVCACCQSNDDTLTNYDEDYGQDR